MSGKLIELLIRLYSSKPSEAIRKDLSSREIVVTDFDGAYGNAGTVIALNGSPPRGVIVSIEGDGQCYPPAIFYLERDRSRRLGDAQAETVREFLRMRKSPPAP